MPRSAVLLSALSGFAAPRAPLRRLSRCLSRCALRAFAALALLHTLLHTLLHPLLHVLLRRLLRAPLRPLLRTPACNPAFACAPALLGRRQTALFSVPLPALWLCLSQVLLAGSTLAAPPERWQALISPLFLQPPQQQSKLDGAVSAIAEDGEGFIWFVGGSRLWRWDAHALKDVPLTGGPNVVRADGGGGLWVGGDPGLYRWQPASQQLAPVAPDLFGSLAVADLAFADADRVLLRTSDGLKLWSVTAHTLQPLSLPDSPAGTRIHALHASAGEVWVGTGDGLYRLPAGRDALERVDVLPGRPRIAALLRDSQGHLWVGTANAGLFVIDSEQRVQHLAVPLEAGQPAQAWIFALAEADADTLWLGSFGKGIFPVRRHAGTAALELGAALRHNRLLPESLLDDNIWTLLRDRRGQLWVGSSQGLQLHDPRRTGIGNIFGDVGDARGLSSAGSNAALATADDRLWIGGSNGNIDVLDPLRGRITGLTAGSDARWPADAVESLSVLADGRVLAASNFQSVLLQLSGTERLQLAPLSTPPRAARQFTASAVPFAGRLWLGAPDGLWWQNERTAPADGSAQAVQVLDGSTPAQRVDPMHVQGDNLWLGTWRGLYRLRLAPDKPAGVQIDAVDHAPLMAVSISDISSDAQQRLWVATSGAGVFVSDSAQLHWQQLDRRHGLPGEVITGLQLDAQGNAWISSHHELARIDAASFAVTRISAAAGAAAGPYKRGAATKTLAGEIVFAGARGITLIDPQRWQSREETLPLVFTSLQISNLDATPAGDANTSAQNLAHNQAHANASTIAGAVRQLTLTSDTQRLDLEFAALDYRNPEQLHYRYRLQGHDAQWRVTDDRHRSLSYSHLPPGEYRLQIQYARLPGSFTDPAEPVVPENRTESRTENETEPGASANPTLELALIVLPAWHQQTGVRVLLLLAVATLLYGLHRLRIRVLRARQLQLEQHIAERTRELARANARLQLQTQALQEASLTDPLTGLRNRRFLSENIANDLAIVHRRHAASARDPQQAHGDADLIFFLVDIDHFKQINDRHGHAAGDAVLVEMRRRLQRVFRDADYLVRWGGEEFLILARFTARTRANDLAERIRQAVTGSAFDLGNQQQRVMTCSTGYAVYPQFTKRPDALSWPETLALADIALYTAKHGGRDTWSGFAGSEEIVDDEQLQQLKTDPAAILQLPGVELQMRKPDQQTDADGQRSDSPVSDG